KPSSGLKAPIAIISRSEISRRFSVMRGSFSTERRSRSRSSPVAKRSTSVPPWGAMVSVIDFSSAGFSTVAVGSEREGQRSGGASPEIERAKRRPIVRSETEEHAERFDGEQRAEDLWRRPAAVLAQSHVNEAWRTRVATRK